ncbi:hypothetical protein M378DRAFT_317426 [Amanita muscaria Koide BX008]|uniref:Uncharacterized protein n=1 Tax=Amanita muscaria (strain Koide BX008) TaxID=946122 RepID=A0A0C2S6T5_AMAMK|nr:hypothetical protein M378DRAFT_317426 [Amanita muscaria Koide BX008]
MFSTCRTFPCDQSYIYVHSVTRDGTRHMDKTGQDSIHIITHFHVLAQGQENNKRVEHTGANVYSTACAVRRNASGRRIE